MAHRPSSGSSSSSPGAGADTSLTKIFVGGLAWETQCESMRRYFEQFGEIVEAVVIVDKHTGRSKGYGFVTFREPEAARQACMNPAPFIDGRRTNCNLAVLGAHRSRPASPLFQGTRFLPLMGDLSGQAVIGGAPQFGHPLPFPYHHQGYPYPSPLHGYPAYSAEYYASPTMYNPYASHPQQLGGAVYQHQVPFSPTFQHIQSQNMQQQSAGQQEPQVQRGGPFAMPPSPLNLPPYFFPPPFIQSPGHLSPSASQDPSTSRLVLQAPPFTPAGGGPDHQSSG
ncbi:hypothetical protein GOP47_0026358 [Adiantum capillus-veneris]|nr:hypothetical protein GOP47_0026358 [Adiantum capillus-veneris]